MARARGALCKAAKVRRGRADQGHVRGARAVRCRRARAVVVRARVQLTSHALRPPSRSRERAKVDEDRLSSCVCRCSCDAPHATSDWLDSPPYLPPARGSFGQREAKHRAQQRAELESLLTRINTRRDEHAKQRDIDSKRLLQRASQCTASASARVRADVISARAPPCRQQERDGRARRAARGRGARADGRDQGVAAPAALCARHAAHRHGQAERVAPRAMSGHGCGLRTRLRVRGRSLWVQSSRAR